MFLSRSTRRFRRSSSTLALYRAGWTRLSWRLDSSPRRLVLVRDPQRPRLVVHLRRAVEETRVRPPSSSSPRDDRVPKSPSPSGQVTVSCALHWPSLVRRAQESISVSTRTSTACCGHQRGSDGLLDHRPSAAGGITERAVLDVLLLPAQMMPKRSSSLLAGLRGPSYPRGRPLPNIHIGIGHGGNQAGGNPGFPHERPSLGLITTPGRGWRSRPGQPDLPRGRVLYHLSATF